jgi:arylsulfatase A-like enzyme
MKKNVVIISLEEVRYDHLGCYGYTPSNTPNIDELAKSGVLFETCVASADFTPLALSSMLTGKYPYKTGVRDPYSYIQPPTIAEILKKRGYKTAGFVGNSLLGTQHGFAKGCDHFNEPVEGKTPDMTQFPGEDLKIYLGNYWVEDMMSWLENNYESPFFMWGHLHETHEGTEHELIKRGLIKEGELTDFGYYDAKINMLDEKLIGRLINTLKKLGKYEDTLLVIVGDHGTNLADHEVPPLPWRGGKVTYPQHTSMYDHDIRIALIIKDKALPEGKRVKGQVRAIDTIPTVLELCEIPTEDYGFDGESLLQPIKEGVAKGRVAYSEDLFDPRTPGAIQGLRVEEDDSIYKFMRNLTLGTEEYYDLLKDPEEKNNIIDKVDKDHLIYTRKELNKFLMTKIVGKTEDFSNQEKEKINERLRALGYIE